MMRIDKVISILEAVAAGYDPGTGELIGAKVFHAPDVIRAFFAAAQLLRQMPATSPATPEEGRSLRSEKPAVAGSRWSSEEDAKVCAEFDGGMSIHDIATEHNRTRGAITSRLVKLGRIDPDTVNVRDRVRRAS